MESTDGLFYVTKLIATRNLAGFVDSLNKRTRDGHIAGQIRVSRSLWLLRIACSWRDDAALIRTM